MSPVGGSCQSPVTVTPDTPVTIGRGTDCLVLIEDRQVSKDHAEVRCRDGAWHVTDLGSRNGTYLNRWKLAPNDHVILHDGDLVSFGPCTYQVLIGDEKEGDSRSSMTYATHASMFVRLRDERSDHKELAWEEFRNRYAPVVIGYCRNAGVKSQDAQDMLQEVMMGFFRLSPEFEYDPKKGRFRGYLKTATLNAIRKQARKSPKHAGEEILDAVAEPDEDAWESHWDGQVLARAIDEAGRRFDAQTFEAFELYARRNVPAEEVANRLGMNVNSVHQAKSRVLRVVEAIIERIREEEG